MLHRWASAGLLGAFCTAMAVDLQVQAKSSLHWQPTWQAHAFDSVAERWNENWESRFLDAQTAQDWATLPDFFQVQIHSKWDSYGELYAEIPLARDAHAWQRDAWGGNVPLSADELDINVPKTVFWKYQGRSQSLQLGRFRPQTGDSVYGIALGSGLWQDALQWSLGSPRFSYEVLWSSLNPWLVGNVDSLTGEWALQNRSVMPNQHGRIYKDPYKTLTQHRLRYQGTYVQLGLQEISVIGGVAPSWRTVQPLMFLHNNYSDGLNNTLFSFSGALIWPWSTGHVRLRGEFALDDLQAGSGEESGDNPMIQANSRALEWEQNSKWGHWSALFQWIQTDAAYGNTPLPLLKMTDRHVYRSNSNLRENPGYFDTYIADIPLGYFRGPDCRDLWLSAAWSRGDWSSQMSLAWLQRGSVRLSTAWDNALSGIGDAVPESEGRFGWNATWNSGLYRYQMGLERRDLWEPLWHFYIGLSGTWTLFRAS